MLAAGASKSTDAVRGLSGVTPEQLIGCKWATSPELRGPPRRRVMDAEKEAHASSMAKLRRPA